MPTGALSSRADARSFGGDEVDNKPFAHAGPPHSTHPINSCWGRAVQQRQQPTGPKGGRQRCGLRTRSPSRKPRERHRDNDIQHLRGSQGTLDRHRRRGTGGTQCQGIQGTLGGLTGLNLLRESWVVVVGRSHGVAGFTKRTQVPLPYLPPPRPTMSMPTPPCTRHDTHKTRTNLKHAP
jgi:hypothetical protein